MSDKPFVVGRTLRTSNEFPEGVPCVLVDGDSVYAEFPSSSGMVKAECVCRLLNADHALSEAMCRD